MHSRWLIFVAVLALAFVTDSTMSSGSPSTQHPSGIEVLPPIRTASPLPEPLALALNDAQELTRQHPDDLAEPFVDQTAQALVLSATTVNGDAIAAAWSPRAGTAGVLRQTRRVTRSQSDLLRIREEVKERGVSALPDSDVIQGVTTEGEGNRVVLVVNRLSDKLLFSLAARYGASAVAVRLDPAFGPFTNVGRNDDTSPFWGGAKVNNYNQPIEGACTGGFAWSWNGASKIITAGHCAESGGTFYASGANGPFTTYMGYVQPL